MEAMEQEVMEQEIETAEPVDAGEPVGEPVDGQAETGPTGEKEPEPWLEESDDHTSEVMPVATHIKAKAKLKGKISERENEITALKAEIEAMKTARTQTAPVDIAAIMPPQEWEFYTDEDYRNALAVYNHRLADTSAKKALEEQKKKEEEEKSKQAIESAVEEHFERAQKLIQSSGISPELYKAADSKWRSATNAAAPKDATPEWGDKVVDYLISIIGDGSEKVAFYIGNNEAARTKYQSLLLTDPSGLKAAFYLGEEKARLSGQQIKNKVSRAPDPAPNATNGKTVSTTALSLKKQYDAAKDPQDMFNIKRKARLEGVDTSKW